MQHLYGEKAHVSDWMGGGRVCGLIAILCSNVSTCKNVLTCESHTEQNTCPFIAKHCGKYYILDLIYN